MGVVFLLGARYYPRGYYRPLYPAHVDASDSEFWKLLPVSGTGFLESWRAFRGLFLFLVVVLTTLSS